MGCTGTGLLADGSLCPACGGCPSSSATCDQMGASAPRVAEAPSMLASVVDHHLELHQQVVKLRHHVDELSAHLASLVAQGPVRGPAVGEDMRGEVVDLRGQVADLAAKLEAGEQLRAELRAELDKVRTELAELAARRRGRPAVAPAGDDTPPAAVPAAEAPK